MDFAKLALGVTGLALLGPVAAQMVMPPTFELNADPKTVLSTYPLGSIPQQAAFSHHGGAHRAVTLSNGSTGWIYNVGGKEWHRTYTLVFDRQRMVSDVLYYDRGKRGGGLSALVLQSREAVFGAGGLGPPPNR